jgi:hypothetical protein
MTKIQIKCLLKYVFEERILYIYFEKRGRERERKKTDVNKTTLQLFSFLGI